MNKPNIGHSHVTYAGGGLGCVAYVSPDQQPCDYVKQFDCNATIQLLEEAIKSLKEGNGTAATRACGAAWFRISAYHHS